MQRWEILAREKSRRYRMAIEAEHEVAEILRANGLDVKEMEPTNNGFDLLVRGKVRINVKTSSLCTIYSSCLGRNYDRRAWSFSFKRQRKSRLQCDFFIVRLTDAVAKGSHLYVYFPYASAKGGSVTPRQLERGTGKLPRLPLEQLISALKEAA